MQAIASHPTPPTNVQTFSWQWQDRLVEVVYETFGRGLPVLLLPAFSTVSTRQEMAGIAQKLASQFQVIIPDFPGFGASSRPKLDYNPDLLSQFLRDFCNYLGSEPINVVSAGHASGYAMQLGSSQPGIWSTIILVAPTWRGPLPTMGAKPEVAKVVRDVVRSPILGQFLYFLNTQPSFLKLMYSRHVFNDPSHLTDDFIQQKWQVTHQNGARYAPAAFVTGNLDPARSREEFLAWFQPLPAPTMVIIPEQAPPKSLAEMETIAELPGVESVRLSGSLGLHEEYAQEVGEAIAQFLST
ncbi:alpha/beta fold hydrolase [Merismopedia glauca]|uniref:Alpha/beta hydrolase n=1 Tax=Merismopedia glauca CCAP 1448/3 TaxID=1296344 RepID=A0A2T1C6Y0_9CYAN|nr:alpha/beta hydrolase [Merismopedia glauca]PSB04032.1 alpha/beta hydrolase [Merismopedia glauca CCAP 1448/3]